METKGSHHSLPFCYDFVDAQGAVKRGRPALPVRWKRENTQVSLKLEHRKQLGLKGGVGRAPVFLETIGAPKSNYR